VDHITLYMIMAVTVVAVIVALSAVSDRLGVAPPLILMLVGVGISLLPFVGSITISPELILAGILPPLLYAAAVSIPTVDLRRDYAAVGGLAVVLVVVSAVVLGLVIHLLIPGVSLPVGIALGAILSPTDAAATTIVKRLGVPSRVRIILQGESLLNDATALVLLRTAIAATAIGVSFWGAIGSFLWAAVVAAAIGFVVGWAGIRLRRLVHGPAPATAISFLLPFVAYVPAELAQASGFVAVVAAGLVTAQMSPKHLDARQRMSERANWQTVEFLLEGAVFFAMGLELYGLIVDVHHTHESLWIAAGVAGLALLIVLVVRWIYLLVLVRGTRRTTRRKADRTQRWQQVREAARSDLDGVSERRAQVRARVEEADEATRARFETRMHQWRLRMGRYLHDVEYLIRQPLGGKEAALLAWAGMRGVVTLAAAQTLPLDTPHRSILILIAFFVAAGSLVIQGATLSWVISALGLAGADDQADDEWDRIQADLDRATQNADLSALEGPARETGPDQVALVQLRARRQALLELRSVGAYSCQTLATALAELDAQELAIQLRFSVGE